MTTQSLEFRAALTMLVQQVLFAPVSKAFLNIIALLKGNADVTCEDGTVHLVGADAVSRGRVEYCYQSRWYSVCASDWAWDGEEARVICKTLGYNTAYYGNNNNHRELFKCYCYQNQLYITLVEELALFCR